jgi:hypothetical protein
MLILDYRKYHILHEERIKQENKKGFRFPDSAACHMNTADCCFMKLILETLDIHPGINMQNCNPVGNHPYLLVLGACNPVYVPSLAR